MTDTKLKFNTGRGYSPEGQIITAVLVSTAPCPLFGTPLHTVDFHDVTRGIRGRVTVCDFTEASVLAAYDRVDTALRTTTMTPRTTPTWPSCAANNWPLTLVTT